MSNPSYPARPVNPILRASHPLAGSLVALWSPGDGGVRVRDYSGRGHHALLPGPTSIFGWSHGPGRFGPCLDLAINGASSAYFAPILSAPLLTAGQPFTIAWWEKPASAGGTHFSRFMFGVAGSLSAKGFTLGRSDSSNWGIYFGGPGSTGGGFIGGAPVPSLASSFGIWRHWAVVARKGPTSTTTADWTIFCDGVAYSATVIGLGAFPNTINRVGYNSIDNGTAAMLDGIALFSRALSHSEIELHRSDPFGPVRPTPRRAGVVPMIPVLVAGSITLETIAPTQVEASASDATGGLPPYLYQWYRSTTPGTLGAVLVGQTSPTLVDTGLTVSTTYHYTIRYTDSSTPPLVVDSVQVPATTTLDPMTPGTITFGTITSSTVEAGASEATGGLAPYFYQWYRSTTPGMLGAALPLRTSRILADSGLTELTSYYYTIRYTDSSTPPLVVDSVQQLAATTAMVIPTVSLDEQSIDRIVAAMRAGAPLPVDVKALDGSIPAAQAMKAYFLEPITPVSAIGDDLIPRLTTATIGTATELTNVTPIANAVAALLPSSTIGSVGFVSDPASIAEAVAAAVVQLEEIVEALTPLIPTASENAQATAQAVGVLQLNLATVLSANTTGFTATVTAPDGTPVSAGSTGFKNMNAIPQFGWNFRRMITDHSAVDLTHSFLVDPENPWPADAVPPVGSLVILG